MKIKLAVGSGIGLALLVAFVALYGCDLAIRIFGPPAVTMAESYRPVTDGPTFDHSVFGELLGRHVDEAGWVDYAALEKDAERLDAYIRSLAEAPFDELGRDEKLALLINAYNAFTLRLILDYRDGGELESIRDIPETSRWDDQRWNIAGQTYSLSQLEHEQIRPRFKEPRVHWALVCAAHSCPPLRDEVYGGATLDAQLDAQEAYVHTHPRWYRQGNDDAIALTSLYRWYGGDFEQAAGSVQRYVADLVPHVERMLDEGRDPDVEWIEYDWGLNDIANRPTRQGAER